jgi:hypothetical protein
MRSLRRHEHRRSRESLRVGARRQEPPQTAHCRNAMAALRITNIGCAFQGRDCVRVPGKADGHRETRSAGQGSARRKQHIAGRTKKCSLSKVYRRCLVTCRVQSVNSRDPGNDGGSLACATGYPSAAQQGTIASFLPLLDAKRLICTRPIVRGTGSYLDTNNGAAKIAVGRKHRLTSSPLCGAYAAVRRRGLCNCGIAELVR